MKIQSIYNSVYNFDFGRKKFAKRSICYRSGPEYTCLCPLIQTLLINFTNLTSNPHRLFNENQSKLTSHSLSSYYIISMDLCIRGDVQTNANSTYNLQPTAMNTMPKIYENECNACK